MKSMISNFNIYSPKTYNLKKMNYKIQNRKPRTLNLLIVMGIILATLYLLFAGYYSVFAQTEQTDEQKLIETIENAKKIVTEKLIPRRDELFKKLSDLEKENIILKEGLVELEIYKKKAQGYDALSNDIKVMNDRFERIYNILTE